MVTGSGVGVLYGVGDVVGVSRTDGLGVKVEVGSAVDERVAVVCVGFPAQAENDVTRIMSVHQIRIERIRHMDVNLGSSIKYVRDSCR